ncbi:hypothetical protein ALI144C_07895 [Actinosynnema sp. ALI-1.44]|uniref:acyl carrier protein n=1 Tax=Actinosynnema sp. ALI-1.44 TaxID=1933779 RepID=UPI00097BE794|nr:acyl carrier protein [Actinosynnema sp. ALI-1.44]ONI87855.1 hypothetical protein ALI144C_07895 [Actinosynnema sp. ALI-1.44]
MHGSDLRVNELRDKLKTLPHDEALHLIEDEIVRHAATVMQTDPERVERDAALDQMGVDSLMAMELLAIVREQFQCRISPMELMKTSRTLLISTSAKTERCARASPGAVVGR